MTSPAIPQHLAHLVGELAVRALRALGEGAGGELGVGSGGVEEWRIGGRCREAPTASPLNMNVLGRSSQAIQHLAKTRHFRSVPIEVASC